MITPLQARVRLETLRPARLRLILRLLFKLPGCFGNSDKRCVPSRRELRAATLALVMAASATNKGCVPSRRELRAATLALVMAASATNKGCVPSRRELRAATLALVMASHRHSPSLAVICHRDLRWRRYGCSKVSVPHSS